MKTALITGGAGGLGFEFARLAVQDGYKVILVDVQAEALENARLTLERDFKANVYTICQNLALPNAGQELYNELMVERFEVDMLINNVGIGTFGTFGEISWERQNMLLQLNVHLLTQLTHLLLPAMVARRQGKILNLASMAAFQPCPFMAVYYASKAYVLSLTEGLANELKGTGVTITAFCPGPIPTGFQSTVAPRKEDLKFTIFHQTAQDAARVGYKAMMKGKIVAVNTWMNWIMSALPRFLPRKVLTAFTRKMQEANAKSMLHPEKVKAR
ncbi:MAG: SDR family NAD(P)-dependent oxidoreductase [Bacteroidetes bacterium]|nr:MAG: SDR family NAD(P)-dependent oxidoreductase [Bacteroidota bacterium]